VCSSDLFKEWVVNGDTSKALDPYVAATALNKTGSLLAVYSPRMCKYAQYDPDKYPLIDSILRRAPPVDLQEGKQTFETLVDEAKDAISFDPEWKPWHLVTRKKGFPELFIDPAFKARKEQELLANPRPLLGTLQWYRSRNGDNPYGAASLFRWLAFGRFNQDVLDIEENNLKKDPKRYLNWWTKLGYPESEFPLGAKPAAAASAPTSATPATVAKAAPIADTGWAVIPGAKPDKHGWLPMQPSSSPATASASVSTPATEKPTAATSSQTPASTPNKRNWWKPVALGAVSVAAMVGTLALIRAIRRRKAKKRRVAVSG
jgi:hypothetical protein